MSLYFSKATEDNSNETQTMMPIAMNGIIRIDNDTDIKGNVDVIATEILIIKATLKIEGTLNVDGAVLIMSGNLHADFLNFAKGNIIFHSNCLTITFNDCLPGNISAPIDYKTEILSDKINCKYNEETYRYSPSIRS